MFTGHKIKRLPHGHDNAKIKRDPPIAAQGTGNFSEPVFHVRLGLEIKLHIRVDRKVIIAVQADALPFPVVLHGSAINAKPTLFAYGAFCMAEAVLNVLDIESGHRYNLLSDEGQSRVLSAV